MVVASAPVVTVAHIAIVPNAFGTIEIAIGDAVVRVVSQAEAEALVAVLRAVRRASG
ncbi:hypothetical protein [Bradyrhizobium sp. HKCCYLS20291]|uniref:hypothetical protein n=1 Tax=Bradyrhizobium sp. HKCCYLS20291 TaxID=3420766 RepID=UPI003EBEC206